MRIIEEKINTEKIITCPHCSTKLGYTQDDIFTSVDGIGIECPSCHDVITVERFDHLLPFPEGYFYFGNGVKISNEEIEKWVKIGLKHCLETNQNSYMTGSGDTRVTIDYYTDDGYDINVSKGYWNTIISREDALKIINS